MAHGQVTVPVAGELRSVATDGRTVAAEGVYDYNLQKTQEQINQELMNGAGGGSSTPVDAYTKTESDNKYATKTEVTTVSGNVNTLSGTVNTLSGNVSTLSGNIGTLSNTVNQMASSPNNKPTINKTWAEMIQLKNSNGFVPGQTYRITDYRTIGGNGLYNQAGGYANHPFDIIVTALTENTLDEDARAAKRAGDTYFANSNLEAWRLRYILDAANDQRSNGSGYITSESKGWIYYMEDDHHNCCDYDFKNILIEAYKVVDFKYKDWEYGSKQSDPDTYGHWDGTCWIKYIMVSECSEEKNWIVGRMYTVDPNQSKLLYTFSYLKEDGTVIDASVEGVQRSTGKHYPYANQLTAYVSIGSRDNEEVGRQVEPSLNLFVCDWEAAAYAANHDSVLPAHNRFAARCHSNNFGNDCHDNTFDAWCNSNIFGRSCYGNTFNWNITALVAGNFFYMNEMNKVSYLRVGNRCCNNTLGGQVYEVEAGNEFLSNASFGVFNYNVFGNKCYYNHFEDFRHSEVGDQFLQNVIHGSTSNIHAGNHCSNNVFEGGVYHIYMGDNCTANHFEKMVRYVIFGSSTEDLKGYYIGNTIQSYNDHIMLNCTATTSTSNRFMGISVAPRTYSPYYDNTSAGSYEYKVITNNETEQNFPTYYTNGNAKSLNV